MAAPPLPSATKEARSLGEALFSGKKPCFADRAPRIHALHMILYGSAGPTAPKADGHVPPPRAHRPPALKPHSTQKLVAENAGIAILEAMCAGKLEALQGELQPWCLMLWPDGSLLGHDTGALLAALQARFVRDAPAMPINPAVYTAGELASFLPRGVPDAIHALIGADRGLLFTAELDSPRLPRGRVMLALSPDTQGKWRAHNFPLPSPDEAYGAWRPPSTSEHEGERVADRAVRHHLLGHSAQILSLRNESMDRIFLGETLLDVDAWSKKAGETMELDRAIDTVFLETKVLSGKLVTLLGAKVGGAIERGAKDAWKKPLTALDPKVVSTKLGRFDPKTRQVEPLGEAKALVLKTVTLDRTKRELVRWRLGALSLP